MRIVKKPAGIGANARCIDHRFRPGLVFSPGLGISEDGAVDLVPIFCQSYNLDVVGGVASLVKQSPQYGHRESSIIKLTIQIEDSAFEIFRLDVWEQLNGPVAA